MAGARTWHELRELSDEQLVAEHDATANNTQVGLSYYREELSRRMNERSQRAAMRLAWANTLFAAVAAVVAIIALLRT